MAPSRAWASALCLPAGYGTRSHRLGAQRQPRGVHRGRRTAIGLEQFLARLEVEKPVHALIHDLTVIQRLCWLREFHHSPQRGARRQDRAHLARPGHLPGVPGRYPGVANRRFHYPFTNCTACGPRFSIVQALPYDRPNTTMSRFPLCPPVMRNMTIATAASMRSPMPARLRAAVGFLCARG